jgi:hypothetical protein
MYQVLHFYSQEVNPGWKHTIHNHNKTNAIKPKKKKKISTSDSEFKALFANRELDSLPPQRMASPTPQQLHKNFLNHNTLAGQPS